MRPDVILFDFYGTLAVADDEYIDFVDLLVEEGFDERSARSINLAAQTDALDGELHPEVSTDKATYDEWISGHIIDACVAFGASSDRARAIAALYAGWNEEFRNHIGLYPETASVLTALREAGFRMAVCSNWDWDIDEVVAGAGLGGYFDSVWASSRMGVRKPNQLFFDKILQSFAVDRERVVFAGDNWDADIIGALRAGIPAIHVCRHASVCSETHSVAGRVADSPPAVVTVSDLWGVLGNLTSPSSADATEI